MAAWLDLCRFIPTAGGTTDWTFSSAVGGCQSPAAANAVNTTVYKFLAVSTDLTQWEICEGPYNSVGAGSFARTTVLYNSSGTGTKTPGQSGAGTKINFSAPPQVAIIGIKEDLISIEEANSFTATQKKQAQSNIFVGPTTQSLTSGSTATYTTPAGCLWIEVFMTGGGGGGIGCSSSAFVAGSDGTVSTFNGVNANPGKGAALSGTNTVPGAGGTGGTGTATRRGRGGPGEGAVNQLAGSSSVSGAGGNSYFAGGAVGVDASGGTSAGVSADANSGAGGSGAYNNAGAASQIGSGGGAGEFVYLLIPSPSATYTYTIGGGGAGGASTVNGGAGGSGFIFVIEHYGS